MVLDEYISKRLFFPATTPQKIPGKKHRLQTPAPNPYLGMYNVLIVFPEGRGNRPQVYQGFGRLIVCIHSGGFGSPSGLDSAKFGDPLGV